MTNLKPHDLCNCSWSDKHQSNQRTNQSNCSPGEKSQILAISWQFLLPLVIIIGFGSFLEAFSLAMQLLTVALSGWKAVLFSIVFPLDGLILFPSEVTYFPVTCDLTNEWLTVFFTAVNQYYGNSQQTMKNRKKKMTQNWSKSTNHNWQTGKTFWSVWRELLLPERSAYYQNHKSGKMQGLNFLWCCFISGQYKNKRQLKTASGCW